MMGLFCFLLFRETFFFLKKHLTVVHEERTLRTIWAIEITLIKQTSLYIIKKSYIIPWPNKAFKIISYSSKTGLYPPSVNSIHVSCTL